MGILLIIVIVLPVLFLWYMWKVAHENHMIEHKLSFPSFPASFGEINIFFISDIHRRLISEKIIDQVKGKTDLVIIGGDLTEKGVPYTRTEENLRRLNEIAPIYFIWGNNDYEKNRTKLMEIFHKNFVTVLENDYRVLQSDKGEKLYIIGIGEIKYQDICLESVLEPVDKESFKIVICHNPEIWNDVKKEHRISLLLSGHTHGGQIRLFGLGLYPKGKLYQGQETTLLISNGYGTTQLPLRLGARPETHLIKITGNKENEDHP
jgi:predicted MPP superfamily phosphohydrolase